MDFLVVLCILLLMCSIRFKPETNGTFISGMDREPMNTAKGLASLFIMLGHLAQITGNGVLAPHFKRVGLFVVILFFVFSGYGLTKSYQKCGTLKGFWKKRVKSILLPYLFFLIIYVVVDIILGEDTGVKEILCSFVNGTPVVKYSWFVEVIAVFYAAFWAVFLLIKNDVTVCCFLMVCFTAAFCLILKKAGAESFWYNTAFGFVIGMIWAVKEEAVSSALKQHKIWYLLGSIFLFGCVFYCTRVLWLWGGLGECLATACFALLFLLLQYMIPVRSWKIGRILGDISLEVYLSQGLFFMIFSRVFVVTSVWYPVVCTTATLLFAGIMHILLEKITARIQ